MDALHLAGLGVSLIEQGRLPTQSAFPRMFNPYGSAIWTVALLAVSSSVPEEAWSQAVDKYLELCSAQDVYPFRESRGDNQALLDHLSTCRKAVWELVSKVHAQLLDQYSVLHIKRKAFLGVTGFSLVVESSFTLWDPTFVQHLSNLGFVDSDGVWVQKLGPYAEVKLWLPESGRWHISYTVTGTHVPELLERLVSKERLERHLIDLWFNMTKDERPDYVGPRFI